MSERSLIDDVVGRHATPHAMAIGIRETSFDVRTNHPEVLEELRKTYARHERPGPGHRPYQVWAIDGSVELDMEPGSDYLLPNGRAKERYRDVGSERWVVKKKTGLATLFDDRRYVVIGPVLETINQLTNILNAVYMMDMQAQGYLVCQCAGLELQGAGVALAGRSGAGKTTTLFSLLEAGAAYVSNDRLLVRRAAAELEMCGIAKWPRVNAGTMHGNARLRATLKPEDAARYAAMSFDELFGLEEKYDVDISRIFGPSQVVDATRGRRFYYLMWSREGSGFSIDRLDPADPAVWDELGPNLYRDTGVFDRRNAASTFDATIKDRYATGLEGADIWAIRGKVDFPRIGGAILKHLEETSRG